MVCWQILLLMFHSDTATQNEDCMFKIMFRRKWHIKPHLLELSENVRALQIFVQINTMNRMLHPIQIHIRFLLHSLTHSRCCYTCPLSCTSPSFERLWTTTFSIYNNDIKSTTDTRNHIPRISLVSTISKLNRLFRLSLSVP